MKLPLSLAEKLLVLAQGGQLSASSMKHAFVNDLIAEGIITDRRSGRTKSILHVTDTAALSNYLVNKFSIPDLQNYVDFLKNSEVTRAELVQVSSDSKTTNRRTFKGFLVNSYEPIDTLLNGISFVINPTQGTFQFIYAFEKFIPPADVVIIGVENAENFCNIQKQHYLFSDVKALFVSRYPQGQSKDLIKWLQSIPNRYWHFGDFDFAGINIYFQEYKKYLPEKASFFIPENIEQLIEMYGNRKLYDQQQLNVSGEIEDNNIQLLISLLHKYKKGLEQEALMIGR